MLLLDIAKNIVISKDYCQLFGREISDITTKQVWEIIEGWIVIDICQ